VYSEIASNKRRSIFLVVIFVVFISAFGYLLALALNRPGMVVFIVSFAVVYALVSYFASASITLALTRAQPIEKKDAPALYRIVENLTIAGGLPMPSIYIINDDSPNAFSTGKDPKHATVAVTTGLLSIMEPDELEGVIAHELSHIGNYDIRFMALVVVLVAVVAMLSDLFLRITFWTNDNENGGNPILLVMGLLGALLAPIAAILIQMAVSRKREFLADASGALLTRYPDGLAKALKKIADDPRGMSRSNSATASLYIANPLKGKKGMSQSLMSLFDTHPNTAERIRRLHEMGGKA
jgi:heat shock protein HtpX